MARTRLSTRHPKITAKKAGRKPYSSLILAKKKVSSTRITTIAKRKGWKLASAKAKGQNLNSLKKLHTTAKHLGRRFWHAGKASAQAVAKKTSPARMHVVKHLRTPHLRNRVIAYSLMVALAGFGVFNFVHNIFAASATYTVSSQAEWEAGEFWNNTLDTTTSAGDLQIKAGGVGTWATSTPGSPENTRGQFNLAAQVAGAGADLTTDGTYIYLIWGGNLPDFWRYNPDTSTWKQLTDAPTSFFNNSAITYYNGAIYAITGHDGTVTTDATGEFYKYDIATSTWSKLTNAPDSWGTVSGPGGADIKSAGNGKLYAVQGNAQTGFWEYDTVAGTWSDLAPVPDPITASNSHPLGFSSKSFVVSGTTYCSTGCFYVFLGAAAGFYRYDIAADQWYTSTASIPSGSATPQIPVALGSATTGSAMAEDTVNHIIYAFRGANTEFMKYTVGDVAELSAGTWDAATGTTENTQRNVTTGAALVYLNGYVYGLLGGVPDFVRYDITNSRWDMIVTQAGQGTNADDLTVYVPNGTDCADASGCIFSMAAASTALRRFNIGARTWDTMTATALAVGAGASMCYDGNANLFIAQGGTTTVYSYNIVSGGAGTYNTSVTSPAATGVGSSITCTGNDAFFLLRGGGGANTQLYKYSGGWTTYTLPAPFNSATSGASSGAAISNDGTYVYVLIGNGRGTFLRAAIADGSWTEMKTLPTITSTAGQAYTSVMEYDGLGNLYAIPGKYQKDFWRYDISADTWTRAADLPVRMARSMGISKGVAGSTMYVMRGESGVSTYKFTPTDNNYIPSATWISAPLDLNYADSGTSMTFSASETLNSETITYATRTSSDAVSWSAWASATNGGTISSTPKRYIQVKVVLNSAGGTATPVLSSFTITYTKDSTTPDNPTVSAWGEAAKSNVLTNTGSYYYTNPYFEFTPATQTESAIAGYYAVWTTDSNFDPSDTGTYGEAYFQTGATYLVRREMTRSGSGTTWYLRVAAKDAAGNVASAQTKFQYTYTGIASSSVKQWSSQAEFTATGTTLTNVEATSTPGNVKMSAVTSGAWTTEAPAPVTAGAGTSLIYVSANGKFYTLQTGSTAFRSYDATTKLYASLTAFPIGNTGAGSSSVLVTPNGSTCIDTVGCIFASRGGGQRTFARYNIGGSASVSYGAGVCGASAATTANTWTQCLDTPVGTSFNSGGSLAFDSGSYIYALYGNGQNVYRYSLTANTWTQLSNVDNNIGVGGTLVYAPNGSGCSAAGGCLYASRGGANNTHFYKGTLTAGGAVTWAYAPNTPTTFGDGAAARRINTAIYYTRGYNAANFGANDFYSYDIVTNAWTRLANTPTNIYQGSEQGLAYNADNNFLYTFRGWGENSLFAYDVQNNTWQRTPSIPNFYTQSGFSAGATAYDSATGLLYVARGNGYADFWSYNTSTKVWKQLADVPHTVTTGADAEYIDTSGTANDGVYLLAGAEALGDNIAFFFRYNPTTDAWTQLSYKTGVPANIGEPAAGADLVYDGSDNIYTAQGGTTSFFKYNISGNVWTDMTGAPNSDPLWLANGSGSCAVKINVGGTDYIYLTRANSQTNVYRYNLSTLSWDAAATVESAPAVLVAGDTCVLDGADDGTAKILIPQGSSNTNMYVLDPDGDANGVWTTRTVPQTYSNGALVQGPGNTILGFRGSSTSAMDRYVVATASTGYQQNGTWTSEIIDFNGGQASGLFGYSGIQVTMTAATDAYEVVETRTCSNASCASDANNVNWSTWTAATNKRTINGVDYYTVGSTVAQYGQARVRLTSDQVLTPTIQDVQWGYYVDNTDPNNPSAPVSGYTDSGKGTSVTNDTWTNDLTPYFEWTSSDDANGIGIGSYAVYFGTSASGEPATSPCTNDATNLACKSGSNVYAVAADGVTGSWNALTQSASALTDGTYYLRIKTTDRNGNVTDNAVTAFTYKVDGSNPSDPSGLGVTPSGYSSTNSYDFTWTASSDVGPAGVSQYCYKTNGSDTCVNEGTICSASTCTVTGITAYQTRVNSFSVRARDAALNYSGYTATSYYYAGAAPTAPNNLNVTPGSQTNNNTFTASWDLPTTCLGQTPCSAADILRYCYTVNVVPDASTCGTNYGGNPTPSADGGWTTASQTSTRLLPTFSAAKIQGTNTIYIVAQDAVGNIDYANVITDTYDFTSDAPDIPVGMQITDASDRASSRYTITLTWDAPADVGGGITGYKVFRCIQNSTDCDSPSAVADPPANYATLATTNTLGYLDTSLDTTKTYVYFVRTLGTGGVASGNSTVVSMKPEGKFKSAPALSGQPTQSVRIRSADISWITANDQDVQGNTLAHPASSFVQYGLTTGYGSESGTSDLVNDHSVSLTGLTPNTTYHYRLKWVDVDGNIGLSTDYQFTTLGAPSAPINLTATPTSGTTNSFAFAWSPPTDEGVTIGGYRYSVNSTPTADNTTFTASRSVAAYEAATRQGTNTFYIVATDDSGNINYANYASVDFIANTTPPEAPRNITLTDSSDRDAKRYTLTLTWDAPTGTTKGNVFYTINRATNGVDFKEIATITSTGYLDTELDSATTYSYKVTAQDKAQATSTPTKVVSDIPEGRFTAAPAITVAPVVTPDSFAATITWTTEREASSFIDYGLSADKITEEQGTADQQSEHSVRVTGLQASTTYHFKVKSIDIDENIAYSEVSTFTTLEAPRVENVKIKDVRLNDAVITWTTTKEASAVIQYGPTQTYGFTYTDTSGSFSLTHTVKLESLKDGTTYHFRIEGVDRSDNPIASDDYNFTTLTYPKVLKTGAENKAEGQTEVKWTTNVPTTSEVEYYNDKSPNKTQGNSSLVTEHSILVFGLEDATEYKYKVRGRDQFGYEAVSTESKFRTLEDTTPPVISEVKSESNTVGSGDAAKIQIIVSWKTNEPTTSQVQYGEGLSGSSYSAESDENAERVREHLMVIGGLTPAKTYHFRVVSKDKAGNESKSQGYSILTSRARQSFLQIVIGNLEDTFSWLGGVGKLFGG